jgi:hypothetical protein
MDEFVWFRVQLQALMGMITSLWGKFGDWLSDHQLLNKDSATWCSNKMPLYDVILPVRSTELQCLTACVTVAKRLAV